MSRPAAFFIHLLVLSGLSLAALYICGEFARTQSPDEVGMVLRVNGEVADLSPQTVATLHMASLLYPLMLAAYLLAVTVCHATRSHPTPAPTVVVTPTPMPEVVPVESSQVQEVGPSLSLMKRSPVGVVSDEAVVHPLTPVAARPLFADEHANNHTSEHTGDYVGGHPDNYPVGRVEDRPMEQAHQA